MGPSAIRLAGLDERVSSLGCDMLDLGNVQVEQPESQHPGRENARYLQQIVQTCTRLAEIVHEAVGGGRLPLVLGGDHSIAVGTVSGLAKFHRARNEKIGLIWIDAHADMNTPESSPSGNVHGMPLACCTGHGPPELTNIFGFAPKVEAKNVALVGLRDVDRAEVLNVRSIGVRAFTMRDIDEHGLRAVMNQAIAAASQGTAGFHVSFDMESVDPDEAPGVGTPVRGGLTYREAHLAMEIINDSGRMLGMEVVEVNPVLDAANRTAILGVELVMSALGKRIL
jgi:arginase